MDKDVSLGIIIVLAIITYFIMRYVEKKSEYIPERFPYRKMFPKPFVDEVLDKYHQGLTYNDLKIICKKHDRVMTQMRMLYIEAKLVWPNKPSKPNKLRKSKQLKLFE